MGSLSDNGGGWPPDGGMPDGLPDLPPEWGDIVVPDDLSALADEVAAVQAELHLGRHRTPWQRFTDRPGTRWLRRFGRPGMRIPILIVTTAALVTVASLFASAWPGPSRPPVPQRTTGATSDSGERNDLPALELIGTDGQAVALRGRLPAVVLMIDGCECAQLVADTTAAVRPGIAVITVVSGTRPAGSSMGGTAPQTGAAPQTGTPTGQQTGAAPQAQGTTVRELRDPTGELRKAFNLAAPDGTAAALIVGQTGQLVHKVLRTASVEDFRPHLARL